MLGKKAQESEQALSQIQKELTTQKQNAQKLFDEISLNVSGGKIETAASALEELKKNHPLSEHIPRSRQIIEEAKRKADLARQTRIQEARKALTFMRTTGDKFGQMTWYLPRNLCSIFFVREDMTRGAVSDFTQKAMREAEATGQEVVVLANYYDALAVSELQILPYVGIGTDGKVLTRLLMSINYLQSDAWAFIDELQFSFAGKAGSIKWEKPEREINRGRTATEKQDQLISIQGIEMLREFVKAKTGQIRFKGSKKSFEFTATPKMMTSLNDFLKAYSILNS